MNGMKPYDMNAVVEVVRGNDIDIVCGAYIVTQMYAMQEDPLGYARKNIEVSSLSAELKKEVQGRLNYVARNVFLAMERVDLIARYGL